MRLLILSNLFPTPAEPARGVFTGELVRHLTPLCDLTVVVPLPWFPNSRIARRLMPRYAAQFGGIPSSTLWHGAPVYYARYPLLPRLSESWHDRTMRLGIGGLVRRLHRTRAFDAINAHWLYPDGVVAVELARQLHVPVVLTALGSDVNKEMLEDVKRRRVVAAARRANAVTVVATELKDKLASAGVPAARIVVIGNGIDTKKFAVRDRAECRRRLGIAEGHKVIVCVARLSEEKGIAILLRAFASVRDQVPEARLFVIGEGPDRALLEELRRHLTCQSEMAFLGALPHERIPEWLGAADVACLPSFREGHPNAVMEALACGRPVVASRVGAVADHVSTDSGLLVEPGDPNALAAALRGALLTGWNAGRIAASVSSRTWDVVAHEYLQVMEEVAKGPDQAPLTRRQSG
jgi:glycosyltransferase involved in cell wall biosynthesis